MAVRGRRDRAECPSHPLSSRPHHRSSFLCSALQLPGRHCLSFSRGAQGDRKYLAGLQMGRYFPVSFRETASRKKILKANESGFEVGGFRVSCCPLNHPQGSVAYRIEEGGEASFLPRTLNRPTAAWTSAWPPSSAAPPTSYTTRHSLSGNTGSGRAGGTAPGSRERRLARAGGVRNLVLSHFNPDTMTAGSPAWSGRPGKSSEGRSPPGRVEGEGRT